MTFPEISQLIGGVILALAGLPQLIRVIKTKETKGISVLTYIAIIVGNILMLVYAIELFRIGIGFVLITTVSLGIIIISGTLFSIMYYRRETS